MWPKGTVNADYYHPVKSDVPVLVLSGEVDPVTPPVWGESVVKHLSHGKHIIVPSTGHGVVMTPCGNRVVSDFIEHGSVDGLDTDCVGDIRRPPFFVTPAGPDPSEGDSAPNDQIANARKQFGSVTAVDGVSFVAQDGAITGLLGPNGAGKTTTLRMLYAVMKPDSGEVRVDDVDAVATPQVAQAQARRAAGWFRTLSASDRARTSRLLRRAAGHRERSSSRSEPRNCSTCSTCARSRIGAPPASPTASARRLRWLAHSCTTRRMCCSTNRPTAST